MDHQERSWSDLPADILCLIQKRLLVDECAIFGMVCKSWRFAPPPKPALLLMTFKDGKYCQFYQRTYKAAPDVRFSELDNYKATSKKRYPRLQDTRICSSNFGWLLVREFDPVLEHGDQSLMFFNPFTWKCIYLPLVEDSRNSGIYCFSAPPTSPDCIVITARPIIECTDIIIIKRGEKDWTVTKATHGEEFIPSGSCNPVYFDGRFYFVGERGQIGVYDVKANDWKVYGQQLVKHLHRRYVNRPISMVEDEGGILVVIESYEHQEIHLMRFDLSEMKCEEVESLGDRKALFVSKFASYLETSVAAEAGNKIYFPKFYQGNIGVYYSLASKMYHSFDGSYSSCGPYRLMEPQLCTWIRPLHLKASVKDLVWNHISPASED